MEVPEGSWQPVRAYRSPGLGLTPAEHTVGFTHRYIVYTPKTTRYSPSHLVYQLASHSGCLCGILSVCFASTSSPLIFVIVGEVPVMVWVSLTQFCARGVSEICLPVSASCQTPPVLTIMCNSVTKRKINAPSSSLPNYFATLGY